MKLIRVALPLLLALAFIAPANAQLAAENERVIEEIVAWINDDIVLRNELMSTEEQSVAALTEQNVPAEQLAAQVEKIKQEALLSLIWKRLLAQEAERLYDLDTIKKDLLERFMASRNIDSIDALEQLLAQYHMTRAQLEDRLVLNEAPGFVIDSQIRSRLGVSDEEAMANYEKNRAKYTTAAQVTFREIVLADESGEDASKLAQAKEIVGLARGGADFGELVTRYSEAPSRALGGKIGPVDPADLLEQVRTTLAALEQGATSDPIRVASGWQILELVERVEEKVTPFEEVRDECVNAVRGEKYQPVFEEFVRELWDDASIEVRASYADRLPEEWRSSVKVRK